MARLNTVRARHTELTYEGAPAYAITPEQQLRRSAMSCLLWEQEFYEDGETVANRIASLIPQVEPLIVAGIAIEARNKMNLRHVPLLIVREMARHATHKPYVRLTLREVIQRPDELTEFMAIYMKDGKQKIAKQVQRGLADAFPKFNAYQLAKYNRDGAWKLRDVLFISHAKPKDEEQAAMWKQLIDGTLSVPDTWEVALSAGADKRETFERLIAERKLGALALLRNLRNMTQAGVSPAVMKEAIRSAKTDRVLPFRFIAAARHAPSLVDALDDAMLANLAGQPKLPGTTLVLVDVSASMDARISAKSEMTRMDAAAGLAVLARELCEHAIIATFSNRVMEVPTYRGMALADAVVRSQPHSGTELGEAVTLANTKRYDRIIVLTDEQSRSYVPGPNGKGYMINIASAKNGVGYGPWNHIDGFSERVLDYIREVEQQ